MTRPWVRGALPFLRSGPLWRVHDEAEPALDRFLAEAAYLRVDLDGRAITSRASAHATIGSAFGFPDWYGNSWDAFDDCLGQWVLDHDGALVAVVRHDADVTARQPPMTAVEIGRALLLAKAGVMPSLGAGSTARVDLDVFALGAGGDFDAP